MALMYKPTKFAIKNNEPSLTEIEHKDSCDINKMLRSSYNGQQVRGSSIGIWRNNPDGSPGAYDDVNADSLSIRIQRAELEQELKQASSAREYTADEIKMFEEASPGITKKFKFRTRDEVKYQKLKELEEDKKLTDEVSKELKKEHLKDQVKLRKATPPKEQPRE